ncbi:hypothetical protein KUTeg_008167 [Tegillarca granosa]|uniref:Rho-GAP domain-containing protein n=1 Tax=Tegillarca granosa TaxID=220873 RepID=A0ABQ9FAI2_TEGGR|nr:hypothetical protein KUTeg_008167 [Tegillarca granosa]
MLKLKRLIHKLPEHNFETFRHLAEHLNRVASSGHLNKMDARNLAMMFGPNLVRRSDNDMASLVKDMSDQCRIVETVILHYDWFFSSWDQDSYVPVDDPTDLEGAPVNPSVSKMSCDEDENTVNPRDIVQSIVEAANKKLRHKDKSLDELDAPDNVFQERNIDQEILRHNRMKAQMDTTSRSSPNLSAMSRSSQEQIVKVRQNAESTVDRRMAKSQEIIDTDFSNWDFEKERQSQGSFAKSLVSRHFSDDSLDKNDELEISHGLSNSFSLSRDTIDSLRRIEEEARTLREKEEKRRRDHEKRKKEWQRLEQDIQRTQKEIEIEDSHSVEDLLNIPSHMWHSSSEIFNRLASGRIDSDSLASEYSNTSSSGDSRGISSRLRYGPTSDYSSSTSPTISNDRDKHLKLQEKASGGKYFVIQSTSDQKSHLKPLQGSVESIEALQTKRTNSLETMLEDNQDLKPVKAHKVLNKPRRDHRHRHGNRDSSDHGLRGSRGNLSRSNSMRRGSLDSLIDLYDKHDGHRLSVESSDSEDGSDLLSDLTSTFDQKLQILVNPKYKLTGSAMRLNKSDSSGSSEKEVTPAAHFKLPPQLPLSQCSKFGLCNSSDRLEREFRDPSLHRSPISKTETKVGIASRFERNPTVNSSHAQNTSSFLSNSSHLPMTTQTVVPMETRTSSVMVVLPSPITVLDSKPKLSSVTHHSSDLVTCSSIGHGGEVSSKLDIHPVSKPEINVSKIGRETTATKPIHIKSSSLDLDRPRTSYNIQSNKNSVRVMSPSPQPHKRKEKRQKRRHTVGGTDDIEHFKALMTLQNPKEEPKLSAWEQLQPNVKDTNLSASSSMLSWLQNQRLRGSSPDLSLVPNYHKPKFF